MKLILIILILLTLATPAQAAPTGQASVVVSTCLESIVIWQDAPDAANTYAYVVWDITRHGETYRVDMYYQFRVQVTNGNAVYQGIDWQTTALKADTATVVSGVILELGTDKPVQELAQAGTVFVPGCKRMFMPLVVR